VKATAQWLASTYDEYGPDVCTAGVAHLQHYSADFCVWGDGPPIVLIPGLAGGYSLLGPLARLLSTHFRVIAFQLRGETDCFALRRRFGLSDLLSDLAEFLRQQRLESPTLMGVSFGGILALEFAARYPHRLDRLIVQGVGARFERGFIQRVAGIILSRYPLPSDNPFVNQFFNLLFGGRHSHDPLFQFVTRCCWQTDQSVMAHRFKLVERFDVTPRLPRVRVPTLVLSGDRDLLVSKNSLKCLTKGIANNRHVSLTGAGHLAFVTQPKRVAAEVTRFLNV
jgi:pimeloyl-ACP methyl ester carboxylesterase